MNITDGLSHMSDRIKYCLYAAYGIIVGMILLYALFPSTTVKEYLVADINGRNPEFDLTVDGLEPAFLLGIRLSGIDLNYRGKPFLRVNHITVMPKLWSLLGKEKAFAFDGDTHGGDFEGKGVFSTGKTVDQVDIAADFSGIRIGTIPALQGLPGREITGLLGGKVIYKGKGAASTATVQLTLVDGIVGLQMPILKLDRLDFEKIEADLVFSRTMVQVKTGTLTGAQMDGTFSGTLRLRQPLANSRINLPGMLTLHRPFLDELVQTIPMGLLPKKISGGKAFPVKLKGTFKKPSFTLR
ncbi:MAG: type II secretion system protein GspN [Desulfobacterales bacterium]